MTDLIYITTSIPYVNASPHIGHALELVQADAVARYHRLLGHRVILQTGTDENAQKNVLAAREAGLSVQELVDSNSARFRELVRTLDINADSFIRTTEERHAAGVRRLWAALDPDDLYRKPYEGLYCVGCEDFLGPAELVDGRCPDHLKPPQPFSETNHFFRLSDYQARIETLVEDGSLRIVPEERRSEVLSFLRSGLRDISVSRDARRMGGWGIGVPGDPSQTIYVWIDALINYLTGLTASAEGSWEEVWNSGTKKVHVIGKNVWKFHAVYWPALLLSAGLPVPDEILVHGFLTVNGQKISKSLGNAVDPFAASARRGSESLRHYLLSLSPFADGDYAEGAHDRVHESCLSNGLGNLLTRLCTLCEIAGVERIPPSPEIDAPSGYHESMKGYRFDRAMDAVWNEIRAINAEIDAARPWSHPKTASTVASVLDWTRRLRALGHWLSPFLPRTSRQVCDMLTRSPIRKGEPLFPRMKA